MGPILAVTVKDPSPATGPRYYVIEVSIAWARRHDNFALVSCGLTVGKDGFTAGMLRAALKRFRYREMTETEWQHSGCVSACVLRGAPACHW